MLFNRTRFFLFLAPGRADLWRQRGRTLEKLSSACPADSSYAVQLKQMLVAQRAYRIGLLLNLPDLTVQAEATPAVGWLDRRKLVARRLDYLFPRATLKGAKIGKTRTQLAALRPCVTLTATLQAIVGIGAELDWIAHTALEAPRLIPVALQAMPYICVLKLGDTGLLLAGERGLLLAVRHLPQAQLDGAPLAAEIQSTFAYLQRHGWQPTYDLAFIGFGIALPTVPGLTFTRTALYPAADGYAELLAHVAQSRKSLQPLTQPRLQQRHSIHAFRHGLRYAAMAAACLVLGCFCACWYLFGLIDRQNRSLTEAMATLPPPLAIQDLPLLQRLQHGLDAPLAVAAALPNDEIESLSYQTSPLEAEETYSLQLTATTAPALAGWKLANHPNAMPISGTIGAVAKLQHDTYQYSYAVQP